MENFKAIPILSAPESSPERLQKIRNLFVGFPDTDIRFEWKEKQFVIFLHALDFQRFSARLMSFAENGEPDQELRDFSRQILEAVDSIRSYGLKGEKRLYAGYNDERKVKGRAKKVVDREPYFYATGHNFSKSNHLCPPEYKNKIICGDSEQVLKQLPDKKNQDFAIAKKVDCQFETNGNKQRFEIVVPCVAIEIKTFIPITMLGQSDYEAKRLKEGKPSGNWVEIIPNPIARLFWGANPHTR